jgi:hypothetical protein
MDYSTWKKKNTEESNLENEGARELFPLFLSDDQEAPCPERYENDGRNRVVHHITGKLFPRVHNAKQFSPSKRKNRILCFLIFFRGFVKDIVYLEKYKI